MDLRKEIERLIYWYVPVIIVAFIISSALSSYIKYTNHLSSQEVWFYSSVNILIKYLHHFVIAIWLYVISKQLNQKYVLWSLFGLAAHLFAAVIFLVLYVYEKNEMDS